MAIYLLNFISIPIYDLLIKNKKRLVFIIALQMFLMLSLRSSLDSLSQRKEIPSLLSSADRREVSSRVTPAPKLTTSSG